MLPENVAVDRVLQILEFKNRSASYVQEAIAFVAHTRVPDAGIGFPGVVGEFMWVICHTPFLLEEPWQLLPAKEKKFFYAFELSRTQLLRGKPDTLALNTSLFPLFSSHIHPFEGRDLPELQIPIPAACQVCHVENPAATDSGSIQGVISYSPANFPLPGNDHPVLTPIEWADEAANVIVWKQNRPSWQALEALQDTRESKGARLGVPFDSLLISVAFISGKLHHTKGLSRYLL